MKITSQKELEEAKQIVLEMREQATNEWVISIYDKMLEELNTKGIECVYTPSFLSIEFFGYDIFSPLHKV